MKEIVNFLRQGPADTVHRFQIDEARRRNRLGGAEMLQKSTFARAAYAADFVPRIGPDGFGAALAMAADGEAVGFVAQALQEIEHRTFRIEAERLRGQEREQQWARAPPPAHF